MHPVIRLAGALSIASLAHAGNCTFQTLGDPRNGLAFLAQIEVPNLSIPSALGQIRQLALDGGYEVGSESMEGKTGQLAFIQFKNHPALVVWAKADSQGRVSLTMKLARGQKANPADIESVFCGMLGKLKGGKEGEAIAAAARAKSGAGRVISAKADELSAEIGGEVKSALGPVQRKGKFSKWLIGTGTTATAGEYEEAFAPIRAKYLGRKYKIDGQIYTVAFNTITREMELNFLVTIRRGLLGVKQERQYNDLNYQIKCILAKDQAPFFATLSEGNWVTLTGTVTEVEQDGLLIREARQAQ